MRFSAFTRIPGPRKSSEGPIAKAASSLPGRAGSVSGQVKNAVTNGPLSSPLMGRVSPEGCSLPVLPGAGSCGCSVCAARAGGLQLRREAGAPFRTGRRAGGRAVCGGDLAEPGFLCGLARDREGCLPVRPRLLEFSPR